MTVEDLKTNEGIPADESRSLLLGDAGFLPVEYCPVSIGAHLIGDRWTLLVVRELVVGACGFNEIHRGLPGLNRNMLSERLRYLERLGLIERVISPACRSRRAYALTSCGMGLKAVLMAIGEWSMKWRFPYPADETSDIPMLLWRIYQGIDPSVLPDGRVCIEFRFPDAEPSRGWLRVDGKASAVCMGAPENEPDLIVTCAPKVLFELWYGYRAVAEAASEGAVAFDGAVGLVEGLSKWFTRSPFAEGVERVGAQGSL